MKFGIGAENFRTVGYIMKKLVHLNNYSRDEVLEIFKITEQIL